MVRREYATMLIDVSPGKPDRTNDTGDKARLAVIGASVSTFGDTKQ
jgi:hypothetical protein